MADPTPLIAALKTKLAEEERGLEPLLKLKPTFNKRKGFEKRIAQYKLQIQKLEATIPPHARIGTSNMAPKSARRGDDSSDSTLTDEEPNQQQDHPGHPALLDEKADQQAPTQAQVPGDDSTFSGMDAAQNGPDPARSHDKEVQPCLVATDAEVAHNAGHTQAVSSSAHDLIDATSLDAQTGFESGAAFSPMIASAAAAPDAAAQQPHFQSGHVSFPSRLTAPDATPDVGAPLSPGSEQGFFAATNPQQPRLESGQASIAGGLVAPFAPGSEHGFFAATNAQGPHFKSDQVFFPSGLAAVPCATPYAGAPPSPGSEHGFFAANNAQQPHLESGQASIPGGLAAPGVAPDVGAPLSPPDTFYNSNQVFCPVGCNAAQSANKRIHLLEQEVAFLRERCATLQAQAQTPPKHLQEAVDLYHGAQEPLALDPELQPPAHGIAGQGQDSVSVSSKWPDKFSDQELAALVAASFQTYENDYDIGEVVTHRPTDKWRAKYTKYYNNFDYLYLNKNEQWIKYITDNQLCNGVERDPPSGNLFQKTAWVDLPDSDRAVLNMRGRLVIHQFLADYARDPVNARIPKQMNWIRVLVRSEARFLPEAATTSAPVAMAFFHGASKEGTFCRYHHSERHTYRWEHDRLGLLVGCGYPYIGKAADGTVAAPQPGHLHCGCTIKDALDEFWHFKTAWMSSSNPRYPRQYPVANTVMSPEQRMSILHAMRNPIYIPLGLRYTGVMGWPDMPGTWKNPDYEYRLLKKVRTFVSLKIYEFDKAIGDSQRATGKRGPDESEEHSDRKKLKSP